MEGLAQPKILNVYMLIKQSGMTFIPVSGPTTSTLGTGFYLTQSDAEHIRTLELLKETGTSPNRYHIYELTVPNPAYKE